MEYKTQEEGILLYRFAYIMLGICAVVGIAAVIVAFVIGEAAPGIFGSLMAGVGIWKTKSFYLKYKELKEMNSKEFKKYKKAEEKAIELEHKKEEQRKLKEAQHQREINARRQELAAQGISSCPRCASTSIATVRSLPITSAPGYSGVRELLGDCNTINVCQVCGQKFYPGA